MNTRWLIVIIAGLVATGCTTMHRGVVAMKISDTEAHVCLNKGEVNPGDSVKLFRSVCRDIAGTKGGTSCDKRLLGTGTVTANLNEHYSSIAVPQGVDIREGDIVEKQG